MAPEDRTSVDDIKGILRSGIDAVRDAKPMPALLPERLFIGGRAYSIFWSQESWNASGRDENDYGYSNHKKLTIHINPNQHKDQKADTLLHEVLHCCMAMVGNVDNYKGVSDLEEHIVSTVTPWVLAAFRNNAIVLQYIMSPH